MTDEVRPRICGRCQKVLDLRVDAYGARYEHTFQDAPVDHEPDPVPMPAGWDQGRCDMCNADAPRWELPCRDFTMPDFPGQSSMGSWACCDACAEMVRADDWRGLTDQAVRRMVELLPFADKQAKDGVRELYRRIRENVTGDLRRI